MNPVKDFFLALLLFSPVFVKAQDSCDIQQRMSPDGTKYYSIAAERFYWSADKQLRGGVITDGENYFLSLRPWPFPPKPAGTKLKDNLHVILSNGKEYMLDQYDNRYREDDTVFSMTYMIGKKQLDDFTKFDVNQVAIVMAKDAQPTIYNFKLHKSAVREQLACFIDRRKRRIN